MFKLNFVIGFFLLIFISACSRQENKKILILGDSNGAASDGWAVQLDSICSDYEFCNLSIAGNTIGFDNLNMDTLNTLKNLPSYIVRAKSKLGNIDKVLVWLGTNDCKADFDTLQYIVPDNFNKLLSGIESLSGVVKDDLIVIAPTPYASDSLLEKKYHGGNGRLSKLVKSMEQIANLHGCEFINMYDSLKVDFPKLNKDGVHLSKEGAFKAANIIKNHLIIN